MPEELRLPGSLEVEKMRVQFAPSARIFAQNDLCSTVMYVEQGRVKVFVTSPAGKRAVVAVTRARRHRTVGAGPGRLWPSGAR